MEVKTKELIIKDEKFYFRPNFRAMIEFEKLAKKPIAQLDDESMIDNSMMLYCGVISGMKKEKKKFELSYDDFIDLVDDNLESIMNLVSEDLPEENGKNQ